jgi:cell wall assembly regulator SMI1
MSKDEAVAAYEALRDAIGAMFPDLLDRLRPPVAWSADWSGRPGTEGLHALWSLTSGQVDEVLGVVGGTRLLGPADSEAERGKWTELMHGEGLEAVATPDWDQSRSLDPDAVRGVYFAAGWIPVLAEPREANYLAVDLVPLEGGKPGQIVLCGRDEDEKCVVAPSLAALLHALANECRNGAWELRTARSRRGETTFMQRREGRLLSACKQRTFP